MKVLVLGGIGDMGRMAVINLLSSPKVSAITIADKNIGMAEVFVELVGSNKLSAIEIDVTDEEKLIDLISQHDIVLNTVGPFLKFGKIIAEAAIKAEKHYVDICDDWKPTLEILDDLDEKAKEAGITAIIGIGASPGLTNLMALLASYKLDQVDEVVTAWGLGSEKLNRKLPPFFVSIKKINKIFNARHQVANAPRAPKVNAAILHLLHESIGKIPIFRDERMSEIIALTDATPIEFPGIKKFYSCYIGHPEPVTLPRTIKAKTISNQMFLTEGLTKKLRDYTKRISENQLTITDADILIDKYISKFTTRLQLFFILLARRFKVPPTLCSIAIGKKDNKRKKIAIGLKRYPFGEIMEGMDGMTAVPMVIATTMIIEGKIKKTGVFTPEASIDPEEFFKRYIPYCGDNLSIDDVLIVKEVDL